MRHRHHIDFLFEASPTEINRYVKSDVGSFSDICRTPHTEESEGAFRIVNHRRHSDLVLATYEWQLRSVYMLRVTFTVDALRPFRSPIRRVVARCEGQNARRNRGEREMNLRTGESRRDENGGGVENEEWTDRMGKNAHGRGVRKKNVEKLTQEDETGWLERRVPFIRQTSTGGWCSWNSCPRSPVRRPWRVPRTTVGVAALRRCTSLAAIGSLRLFVFGPSDAPTRPGVPVVQERVTSHEEAASSGGGWPTMPSLES